MVKNVCKLQKAPKVPEREMSSCRTCRASWPCSARSQERLYAPAIVALFSGMRLGEVLALREGRVDLDKGVIEVREALEETKTYGVRFKTAKTKAGRRNITLPTIAVEALRDHRKHLLETRLLLGQGRLAPDDLLFANLEGPTASAQCRIIRLGRPRRAHRHTRHHVSRPSAYPRLAVDRRQC